jgi:tetratricopeptide (TPR) repeat protein
MNNYEFWNELGNIFDAVLAYQKKTVEFNNRFITPWIRLGNVFDRQDHNKEAIEGFQKATEIDPENVQNWNDLGDSYFKTGAFEDAANSYEKAIALDPQAGWSHSNLGLTLASQGKLKEAIPLYTKSLELFIDDKDKAICWNRLGNVYRKLNDYGNAVQAFQNADNLDSENTGFRDQLDETPDVPSVLAEDLGIVLNQQAVSDTIVTTVADGISMESEDVNVLASEDILTGSETIHQIDAILPSEMPDTMATESDGNDGLQENQTGSVEVAVMDPSEIQEHTIELPMHVEKTASEQELETISSEDFIAATISDLPPETSIPEVQPEMVEVVGEITTLPVNLVDADIQKTDLVLEDEAEASYGKDETIKTLTMTFLDLVETYSNDVTVDTGAAEYGTKEQLPVEITEPAHENPAAAISEADSTAVSDQTVIKDETVVVEDTVPMEENHAGCIQPTVQDEGSEDVVLIADALQKTIEEILADEKVVVDLPKQNITNEAAYEEYLNDTIEPVRLPSNDAKETAQEVVDQKPVAQINDVGDVKIEMDTKNAHVWNELGNVYFNSGNYDDAISSYGKAIELDRQFAWSYSNLALAYVQKSRFAEAVLLYQRSIELFTNDKDKAITWNRLGNVYRRQGDYFNAIAAYQTADELDPDNTTLSLKSRFSLLGNFFIEQTPNYVS